MKLEYTRSAQIELDDAINYYEAQSNGLGIALAREAHAAGERIVSHPHVWQRLNELERRCRLNRFPYGLVYVIEGEIALVLAVMHLHRHPEYWKSRL